MRSPDTAPIVVSGIGVTSAIGQGQQAFTEALLAGRQRFGIMARPGRQHEHSAFIGAEIGALELPDSLPRGLLRTASLSGQVALATLHEAWHDAALDGTDPRRIGLVVGGSNLQQREQVLVHEQYRGRADYLRPNYGMAFLDSDLCGLCTEAFGIQGMAYTVGGASASGQLAVIEAIEAVAANRVDICIAVGALMDLSYWECQGLRSLGAMGSDRYADRPDWACRPFDERRDGFIFGENCGALVIERLDRAEARARTPYGILSGWAVAMDAHRNPDPSEDGEVAAIRAALRRAGLSPMAIDYVNPHGTGSPLGDVTELASLRRCELEHAWLNTTKSVTGHGLTAAGAVELIGVLVQMKAGRLHPANNLDQPIAPALRWVRGEARAHRIEAALKLSMGFGGINTALCVQRAA